MNHMPVLVPPFYSWIAVSYDSFCFILLFLSFFDCYVLEVCCFLMRYKKAVNSEGKGCRKELGGVEGKRSYNQEEYFQLKNLLERRVF